jgi:ribosomal protein S18 acetylase RimI-like enzyme
MTSFYGIRAATPDDLPAIRGVLVTTWHATYDHIDGPDAVTRTTDVWHAVDALRSQLHQPDSCFLVGTMSGGTIVATSLAMLKHRTVNVSRLYILPSHQRQGLGTRLLAATLAAFTGAKHIALEVAAGNTSAIAFYARHGFAPVAQPQNCGQLRPGIAALIYRKDL